MSTIVTRSGKGSPLTHVEVDANFTNLNTDKYQEGSAIGAVTPAAGTFTTLTATSTATLGGDASNPTFRANALSGVTRWIEANGSVGGTPQFASSSTGAAAGMNFLTRGSTGFNFSTNTSIGTVQLAVSHTASAVNYVQVTGAATTVAPQISAQGSDTNVGFSVSSKGTGTMSFYTNSVNVNSRHLDITHTGSVVNRFQLTGAITGNGVTLGVNGSDTNISQVFQSKGTGAIDLAAGSSGVNISNGGTVTAITRTATGSSYTGFPTVAITAPTTAGGVQATATAQLVAGSPTVVSGGTGYTLNDVLTVTTSGGSSTITVTVTGVSGGVVTSATASSSALTSIPTNPVSVSGGTGSGATFNLLYVVATTFTITNAGSGYVEQPTVSFSGGGGSGAAAYASVGAATTIKTLFGTTTSGLDLATPAGAQVRIADIGDGTRPLQLNGGSAGAAQIAGLFMNTSGASLGYSTNTGTHAFYTGGRAATEQARVAHTASAVNYVQVTGAATGSRPVISAQGSDTNIDLRLSAKGNGSVNSLGFFVVGTNSFNNVTINGGATGVAPYVAATGGDTNIDLTLTPKGTGNVRFGTYTGTMALTVQGYIEIKDSGGTVRKLAVIA